MSGLTPTGFVADDLDTVLEKIATDEKTAIDSALDTSPKNSLGALNETYASDTATLWALAKSVYDEAFDVDNATGQLLDVLCSLTRTTRRPALSTYVIASCSLDKGHLFNSATLDANGNVTANGDLVAQIAGHPEFVFTAVGIVPAADFAGLGIAPQPIDTTGATVTANYSVLFVCTTPGAIACAAGTLTVISPAVGGWNSVTNAADENVLGSAVETDPALRLRRAAEIVPAGGPNRRALLRSIGPSDGEGNGVTGVISAGLLVNDADATDGNGLPPHSFEAIIWDGAVPAAVDNDIAQAIWNAKPPGVRSYDGGSGISGTAKDSTGASHTVPFNRATQDVYYIAISIKTNDTYPSDGDAQLEAALVAYGNALGTGADVIMWGFLVATAAIAGITDVTVLKIDTASTPVNAADITTLPTHIPQFSTARVTVTHV